MTVPAPMNRTNSGIESSAVMSMSFSHYHPQDELFESESKWIAERRRKLNPPQGSACSSQPCDSARQDVRYLADTLGVCISPGGVRSAAFSLGALQQLSEAGLFDRIDYISCAAGGSCVVASLLSNALALCRRSEGEKRFASQEGEGHDSVHEPSVGMARGSSKLSHISHFSASEFIERSVEQIRLICQDKSPGIFLLAAQKALMLSVSVVITPLIALAACFFIAASISDVLGDPLRSLLLRGFRPFQLAAVFVFFGPVWVGLLCVATSCIGNEEGGGGGGGGGAGG
mmetsp:Transcript_8949/g.20466  ORF Transcript_8949/g.20466 Transcript_8949/m.20466 type:complete len:287 (-) Transcript_8949:28-888(-)